MAEEIVIQTDLELALHDAFRAVLRAVPQQKNIGQLVAYCFEAGVEAERERAAGVTTPLEGKR